MKRKNNWIKRVTKERDKLNKKLYNLTEFMETGEYEFLEPKMRQLLTVQATIMASYVNVLNARLALVEGE